MGITTLVVVALAAAEAVTLVKVRKQGKRIAELESKDEPSIRITPATDK